jgi:Hypothetical methyltransferase
MIIEKIKSFQSDCGQDNNILIADMGCGEAKIARTFNSPESNLRVYSFDLYSSSPDVTVCSISHVVVVFLVVPFLNI